ncbi:MAG: RluA family pseudouridine synthase [Treponema sp.]
MEKQTFIFDKNDAGRRIDRVIRKFLSGVPLPKIYAAIRKGFIRINGKRIPVQYKTSEGDVLTICGVLTSDISRCGASGSLTESMSVCRTRKPVLPAVSVLLRTPDVLIVNKPAGIAVHGREGLTAVLPELCAREDVLQSLSFAPGPLHRLDKYTTGVLCFSQSLNGAQWFSRCLREKMMDKYYLGVVCGSMPSVRIETGEDGTANKKMITDCYQVGYNKKIDAALMLFRLVTGKKHQIRIHAQYTGHPLAGDLRYGGGRCIGKCKGYILHAWRLYFPDDRLAGLPRFIEAPVFSETAECISCFFSDWRKAADDVCRQDCVRRFAGKPSYFYQ